MFLDLLFNYLIYTWKRVFGCNLPFTIGGSMIVSQEGYLVVLSLVLTLVYPLEPPNHVYFLTGILLGAPLGFWFGSEVFRYCYSCCHLMEFFKDTDGRSEISCDPISGTLITSNMNSVRYFQLLGFLILFLPPTLFVPSSGGR